MRRRGVPVAGPGAGGGGESGIGRGSEARRRGASQAVVWEEGGRIRHRWNLSPQEARSLQRELAGRISLRPDPGRVVRRVAGVDVGFEERGRVTRAAVVVFAIDGEPRRIESAVERQPTRFPYVPGLLSFREAPAVLAALEQLSVPPDLLLCDGQGLAHPRRLGIASHLGLLTDLPSVGVAKSRLVGSHGPVPEAKGEWAALMDRGACIGAVLRTRCGVRPVYVSPGHRMDLASAIDYTLRCVTRYRLPEPIRAADRGV